MERRARPVPPGVRHHDIVFTFERARQGLPAGSAPGQSMEEDQRGLGPSGSQVVDVDAACFAGAGHPVRHRRYPSRMSIPPTLCAAPRRELGMLSQVKRKAREAVPSSMDALYS